MRLWQKKYFREKIINEFNFPTDSIIMLHSGKIGILKRTVELLRIFIQIKIRDFA